jgi:hypothetical protein
VLRLRGLPGCLQAGCDPHGTPPGIFSLAASKDKGEWP